MIVNIKMFSSLGYVTNHPTGCAGAISGVRFKCMHPSCPDFDLCADCEALPIPRHPETHPLLKIKTPNVVEVKQQQAESRVTVGQALEIGNGVLQLLSLVSQ